MKNVFKSLLLAGLITTASTPLLAQTEQQRQNWYQLDYKKDTFYGISLQKAYDFLASKSKPVDVVVGVIDSGLDTTHNDLKNVQWINKKEQKGNQVDDDKNGYRDDLHGWNFLGNANGKNVNKEVEEELRVYYQFKDKYEGKQINEKKLSKTQKKEYALWKTAAAKFKLFDVKNQEATVSRLQEFLSFLNKGNEIFQKRLNKQEFVIKELKNLQLENEELKGYKGFFERLASGMGGDKLTNTEVVKNLQKEIERQEEKLKFYKQAPPRYRDEIVKDDYDNFKDKYYGNNDLMAEDPFHGTHVAGIIAAEWNNKGINGIAKNAKIMTLRAIPDGDEYDKDVALAIYYAVDNGAKVINMSFGKRISPEKKWVDKAFAYAAKKDVLLVHAAGNDGRDIDEKPIYPNGDLNTLCRFFGGKKKAKNLITVGASSDPRIDKGRYVASFSNYGEESVDVFAPGVSIYSCAVGENEYAYASGTSMAAPVVAGLAALIRGYYPKLSAVQVKEIIEKSVVYLDEHIKVNKPGMGIEKTTLKELSRTGGIVNAYNAVLLADKMSK